MSFRPPLLLLPGLLCDERLWRDQIAGLAEMADSAVADLARDDTITAMARRAIAMMDGRGSARFAVCGLSMGGYVAAEIWRQAPGRVTHLALLDTSARAIPKRRHAAAKG